MLKQRAQIAELGLRFNEPPRRQLSLPATPLMLQTVRGLKNAISPCFTQITHLRKQIAEDQFDIDRLKQETRKILAELKQS